MCRPSALGASVVDLGGVVVNDVSRRALVAVRGVIDQFGLGLIASEPPPVKPPFRHPTSQGPASLPECLQRWMRITK
jgi:hypothetical protein